MDPFYKRKDLTLNEISALKHFRDLEYPQYKWLYKLRTNRPNTDCDMINGYLRGNIPKSKLRDMEIHLLKRLIRAITRAINKSSVDRKRFMVYKGVAYFEGLKKYVKGKTIVNKAFSSFSTSKKMALKYAGKNPNGEKIIFALWLKKGNKAIYIDEKEGEWLIQKHSHYSIMEIRRYDHHRFWGKAIIYYFKLT